MAGNKVNTKTKGKEDKGRGIKGVTQSNEDGEDLDFALLRKPIPTSITGFAQARKIFDFATEELKDLLSNECDMLYECKVCRNIFRSLANFISHKRVYCQEKFNSSVHGHFVKSSSMLKNEMLQIKRVEEGYQESRRSKNKVDTNDNDDADDRIPLTKDLTAIYEKLTKSKGTVVSGEEPQVSLKKIPSSNIAVFQSMIYDENLDEENMRTQVTELDHMLSCDKAVLQEDGKFTVESSKGNPDKEDSENVIQISDDDDNEDTDSLKCKICDLQFSTQKTLKFHMKYKHLESRLVYPCPDCLEIFSTSWSVYRHLFKVHRKTAAQIRRLRESIQSKAFRMNNPPAFYEKRKNNMKPVPAQKITEEERLDQENQAWMDNMEGDGEVPRCGGCGRTFERRAALAAHTHTCQPRSRALARRVDAKRIEIQIRKDYHKGPNATILKTAENDTNEIKDQNEDSKPDDEKEPDEEAEEKALDEAPMDIDDDQKSDDSRQSPEKLNIVEEDDKPVTRLPFAIQAEKSNFAAFRQRVYSDMNFLNLQCKKCNKKQSTLLSLYAHMAEHVQWMRYACKLCNFKHYNFDKLPEHVKVVHKLKGDSDFYYSTVKAIDGTEAMILSRCLTESEPSEDANEPNETSPESRRPSRCSSDSSRLSDDSSSSSTFKEGSKRKRKMYHNKVGAKRKKDSNINDEGEDQKDGETMVQKAVKSIINDSSANLKSYEENSSDLDDIEEKISKRHNLDDVPSVASRRPVRKRTKPKNEDFEYDLSNLLKMEAQGYRDSQTVTTTKTPIVTTTKTQTVTTPKTFVTTPKPQPVTTKIGGFSKKKVQSETPLNFDRKNKDCCGALYALSKKAADIASAQMKVNTISLYSTRPNIFARPTIPRILSRGDKASPKKDVENVKDINSLSKVLKYAEQSNSQNVIEQNEKESILNVRKIVEKTPGKDDVKSERNEVQKGFRDTLKSVIVKDLRKHKKNVSVLTETQEGETSIINNIDESSTILEQNGTDDSKEKTASNISMPSLKLRRQSLEVMKNPIINKNITDFSKAGMKTKILVIKPINRNTDGLRQVNAPLKFQTIKLKESGKGSSEDKSTDQVMVVKVPKVPCTIAEKINPTMSVNTCTTPVVNTSNHVVAEIRKDDENSNKSILGKIEDIVTNDSEQTARNESPSVSEIKASVSETKAPSPSETKAPSPSEIKAPPVSEIINEPVAEQSEQSVNDTEKPKALEVTT